MNKLPLLLLITLPLLCAAQAAPDGTLSPATALPAPVLQPLPVRGADSMAVLYQKLQLAPAQEPLWQQFVTRIEDYTQQFYRERPAMPSEDEPAPQQITRLLMNQQNRLAALEDVEQAAKALYARLNPDQKKTANLWLLPSIPTFSGQSTGTTSGERRPEMRPGNDMRRRGGSGKGGMGSGRF